MMGVPSYMPLEALTLALPQDDRPHRTRMESFFIKLCATARSSTRQTGVQRALVAKEFRAETPGFVLDILADSFDVQELESIQHLNHGNHSFGDASRLMASWLVFVAHGDILKGCLFNLTFFQYLAPGATLVCVQHGASGAGPVPAGLEVVAQHFAWSQEVPRAKFLRVDRQWQSQVQA